ncbi:hypothetical protein [Streptantibioticus ferralitis]|uniref:TetR family transcriptional regulator n=1 Tax=Streptantibioticus ferralitis TaxID=236510 RepID=A0ABT5Z0C6_9ACTN|nr:hypothetical protein [Streptantibioticus ferralitis]MDF2257287.1 hypothetical protein [Streptantibioticus ferralitis]
MSGSPVLLARVREIVDELADTLAAPLAENHVATGDAQLIAALAVAAHRTVFVTGARRILAGETAAEIVDDHVARLNAAFHAP